MTDAQDEIKSKLGLKSGGRTFRVWPILLVLFAILSAAFVFLQAPRSDQDALGYRLAPVARGDLTVAINATGSVEPTNMVDISSELSGTIAEVFVDFNDVVGLPPLKWSSAMFRKTEENHGKQAPEARRDCQEVTAG